jgi:TolB protein
MADVRRDGEAEPAPDGRRGGSRLRVAFALTLIASIGVLAGIAMSGLLDDGGSPIGSVSPSAAVVAPSDASAVPSGSPRSPASAGPTVSQPAPSAVSPPSAPRSPGLIAVVGDDGSFSTMDDGGGSRVSYPVPGLVLGFPAWSPDGSQIAIVGSGANDTAIYVFDVPRPGAAASGVGSAASPTVGPEPVVIYRSQDRPPFYLYWTPDGRRVGFLATEEVGLSLRIASADGSDLIGGPEQVIRRGAPLYFDWVDAGRLLLHVGVGSDAFTGEVGLDGAAAQPALEGTGLFRSADVSSDGRYLAYVRSDADGSASLVVASREGSASNETEVFGPAAFVFDPAGDTLALVASDVPVAPGVAFPFGPLRLIDPGTGAIRTLLDGPVVAFFWSPDGRTIAAILPDRPSDDQLTTRTGVVLAGAAAPRATPDTVAQAEGVAARLAFVDVATGAVRSERAVELAEQFINQLLPYFDQYALSHRLWSPDSAAILLALVDATGQNQMVAIPAEHADPRPVAGGARGFWSP